MKRSLQFICLILLSLFILKSNAKVTLSMCVHNEGDRYLRMVLEEVKLYIHEAVFIDDACTDDTVAIIYEVLDNIPVHVIRNEVSLFSNEIILRQQQWEETIKTNPEWILNIDADHVFEKSMREEIKRFTNQNKIDVWRFRVYDFWNDTHYRDDELWMMHKMYRSFLLRYKPGYEYVWKETPQHCGHFPKNTHEFPTGYSAVRLKHYGWAREADRIAKYHRNMQLDPGGKYGSQEQYDSILDPHPNLLKWFE